MLKINLVLPYVLNQCSPSKVATIRGNIDKIAQDVDQVKKMHSAMLSAAVQDQGTVEKPDSVCCIFYNFMRRYKLTVFLEMSESLSILQF